MRRCINLWLLKYLFILICFLCGCAITSAQNASFTVKNPICVKELFAPVNTGPIGSYFWHFCSANLTETPKGENTGNIDGQLNNPAFIAIAKEDDGTYYAFITNQKKGNIVRYNYGSSLLNTPTAVDLGNFGNKLPAGHLEGIQVEKDKTTGNWYAFIVGGQITNYRLFRLDFGTSLLANPAIIELQDSLNIKGKFNYPIDLNFIFDKGVWTAFTVNFDPSGITRFNFGNSLANIPTAANLGDFNGNIEHPCGISAVYTTFWSLFITNNVRKDITRLDFKNSLNAPPEVTVLPTDSRLDSPYDISLFKGCDRYYGFLVNRFKNDVVKLEFPDVLGEPTYKSLGNIGGLNYPKGISEIHRIGNEIFALVSSRDNSSISRLYFETCTDPSVLTDTTRNPKPLCYNHPGNYTISLTTNAGLTTESSFCENITVLDKPDATLPNDTTICMQSNLVLQANSGYTKYLWSDSTTNESHSINRKDSLYWLDITNAVGCTDRDTITVTRFTDNLFLGNDTSFTLGESIVLNAGRDYAAYKWSTGETTDNITAIKPGSYWVSVKDAHTCEYNDTINLKLTIDVPNFITPNNDGANDTWNPPLFFHYREASIKILDRFGKTVANYHGYDPGWDGTYNGLPLPADTYWYIIDLKNGIEPFTGQIAIVR